MDDGLGFGVCENINTNSYNHTITLIAKMRFHQWPLRCYLVELVKIISSLIYDI